MLSPKMQRHVRVNDTQLLHLADRAQYDHSMVWYSRANESINEIDFYFLSL